MSRLCVALVCGAIYTSALMAAPPTTWEYKVESFDESSPETSETAHQPERLQQRLNELGADGWELCVVYPAKRLMVFKRRLQSKKKQPGSKQSNAGEGRVQIRFSGPEHFRLFWCDDWQKCGKHDLLPGRYNFALSLLEGHAHVCVDGALTIPAFESTSRDYLARYAVPFEFSNEDIKGVIAGNVVTKVAFLPDREFQELPNQLSIFTSDWRNPGIDVIQEGERRGTLLAILQIGKTTTEKNTKTPCGRKRQAKSACSSNRTKAKVQPKRPRAD